LVNAEIIKVKKSSKVHVGSTVEIKTAGKTVKYTIVGPVEADPMNGKISNESPLGVALMDKEVGDKVTLTTPKGDITYTVESVN
jgi:transcription elongation factor GreA